LTSLRQHHLQYNTQHLDIQLNTKLETALSIMTFSITLIKHDYQYNDTQHYDTQYSDIRHEDIQHNDTHYNDI
jgi:hypothetical protein